MPFYEYECQACKQVSEVLQKISDPPLAKCPSCGKAKLVKLMSASAFRLSGSGWYETDFKSDKEGKRNLAGGEKEAKTETESKTEAKAESKPEAKDKPAASPPATPARKKASAPARTAARSAPASRRPAARAKPKAKAKAPARRR